MKNRIVLLIAIISMALSANAQYRDAGNVLLTVLGDTKEDTLLSKLVQKVGDDPQKAGAVLNFEGGKLQSFTLYNVEMDGFQPYDDVWPFGLDSSYSKEQLFFAFSEPGMELPAEDQLSYSLPGVEVSFEFEGNLLAKGTFTWAGDYSSAGKQVSRDEINDYITRRYRNRLRASGNCQEGDCSNGEGVMEWKSGLKYDGEWKHEFAHGTGKITYPKGGYYEGPMIYGYPHGEGEEESSNGRVWQGGFKKGERHGEGTLVFTDGTKMEGSYVDDTMQGEWVITYPEGQTRTVTYEDGKMVR